MNVRKVLAITLTIAIDIITLILGITGSFISLVTGNFVGAGIIFLAMIVLIIVFSVVGGAIAKDRPVRIKEKKVVNGDTYEEQRLSIKDIKKIASRYQFGVFLGKTARAMVNQADMVAKKIEDARTAVNNRFEYQSITWDRYMGVVDSAADTAMENLDMMARRMNVLDEREYARLANPIKVFSKRNANNSERLEFYNENKAYIERGLSENEEMFNSLDKLAIELQRSADTGTNADAMINDIEEITNQVKYYN